MITHTGTARPLDKITRITAVICAHPHHVSDTLRRR
jgi:hypothetical protein